MQLVLIWKKSASEQNQLPFLSSEGDLLSIKTKSLTLAACVSMTIVMVMPCIVAS